jgi:hypothetical protein
MGYATYCHIRRTVPHAECVTPRPSTPELKREALPTPIAQPPSPAQTPVGRRREDSSTSTASPVQQLIQQFGGIQKAANDVRRSAVAALPTSVAAALPAALGGGAPPRGTTTPRAVPPQTPAAVTPPNVAASSGSTDMSVDAAPAARVSDGAVGPADGALSAPPSGVVSSCPLVLCRGHMLGGPGRGPRGGGCQKGLPGCRLAGHFPFGLWGIQGG